MSEQKPLIYGIIHIGSSNLSLRIVEYKNVNASTAFHLLLLILMRMINLSVSLYSVILL